MPEKDSFHFYRSGHLDGVTLLDAAITEFRYARHTHHEYSVAVTRRGYQHFYCDGTFYRVPRGGVIQINPDTPHDGFADDPSGFSYSIAYLPRERVQAVMRSLGHGRRRELRFRDTVLDDPALRRNLLRLMGTLKQSGGDGLRAEENFVEAVEALCRVNGQTPSASVRLSRRDVLVSRARDYLHDHAQEAVALEDLAEQLNVSKYHLIRLFRRQMGYTPYRYLLDCRVNAARRALEERGDAIEDVMERFGFYDQSHFNRRFKEIYGTTPGAFRRQILSARC